MPPAVVPDPQTEGATQSHTKVDIDAAGHGLLSDDGTGLLTEDRTGLPSKDRTGLLSAGHGLLSKDRTGLLTENRTGLPSKDRTGLLSAGHSLLSDDGTGLLSDDGPDHPHAGYLHLTVNRGGRRRGIHHDHGHDPRDNGESDIEADPTHPTAPGSKGQRRGVDLGQGQIPGQGQGLKVTGR